MRVFLNKFSFSLSLGYGVTEYKNNLKDFGFYQDSSTQLILRRDLEYGADTIGFSNWLTNPLEDTVSTPATMFGDSIGLAFQNQTGTIPISLSVHYNFNKIRIGGGFSYQQQNLKPLEPNVYKDSIRAYDLGYKSAGLTRFWGMAGYQFYEWWDYTFVGELRLGVSKYGKKFDSPFITTGLFYNLGVNIERNFSEYFRVIIRPSFDIKSFKIELPDGDPIKLTSNAFLMQVGVSFNIPEIPRSPMKSDHIQLKHVLSDEEGRLYEYRGQPIWKVQNPKVGQNHRRLWRYKLKNRRKLDPY
ncbi:MAG: hypothetical protein ACFHWX_10145 [Bacteroidota bacterium]